MLFLLGIIAILSLLAITGLQGARIARLIHKSSPTLFVFLALLYAGELGLGFATIALFVSQMLK